VTTLRAERRIAADPTSVALLLAGPTAVDLWPGSHRDGESDGRLRVEADIPQQGTHHIYVTIDAPLRTPVAFVCRFTAEQPQLGLHVDGELTLAYDGPDATLASIALEVSTPVPSNAEKTSIATDRALSFLGNLARVAEAAAAA